MLLLQVCLLTAFAVISYVWWKKKQFQEFGDEKPSKDGLNVMKIMLRILKTESKGQ